jgi:4-hydroxyphenylpyruvate dioxygenase-like putative hemolysin
MSNGRSSEETTVFAIYSTRRDAEMAQEYLRDRNIEAFVQSDDAGGMHPQMQRPHGAKLVGMSNAVQDAYEALNEADLLPQPVDDSEGKGEEAASEDLTMSMSGAVGLLGVTAVVLLLFYLLLA